MFFLKYIYIGLIFLGFTFHIYSQPISHHITLLSAWNSLSAPNKNGQKFNDVVGWYDPIKKKEYAILGGLDSIYFFDITNPNQIVLVDAEAGRSSQCINRDFEVYKNYCYAVADEGQASLQIFNLQSLPDSVQKVYDEDSICANAHTIFRENNKLYVSKNRVNNTVHAMDIFDLSNPEIPNRIGRLKPAIVSGKSLFDYVHDVYVKNDTAFFSCGNDGMYIYDCTNSSLIKYISSLTQYPQSGYNHSSYMHQTQRYLYFTDENNGSGIKVVDFTKIKQPDVKLIVETAPGAIPHNTYVSGRFLYVSSYQEGIKIYDIGKADEPKEVAWYDTYLQNAPYDYQGFKGCWAVFPWLPSGVLLASDTHNGLFVLSPDSNLSLPSFNNQEFNIYPNPVQDILTIDLPQQQDLQINIYNEIGQLVDVFISSDHHSCISLKHLRSGFYILVCNSSGKTYYKKVVKL